MKQAGSLRRRLLAASALWIGIGLVVVGVLLVALFRQHIEAEAADRAGESLDALTAALSLAAPAAPAVPAANGSGSSDAAGPPPLANTSTAALSLSRELTDPAFSQPLGGRYWWVQGAAGTLLRSRSWWDELPDPALAGRWTGLAPGHTSRWTSTGPAQQPLVLWARPVELAGLDQPVVVAVAVDASRQAQQTRGFARTVAAALCGLALVLWAAAALQVRSGLAPLGHLQAALRRLRAGQSQQLDGAWPAEVQPLVDDLNGVLVDNQRLVQLSREQTGNLAHGLKTPLAVIGNAAARWPGEEGALVRQQLALLQRQVDLHLVRARSAARASAATGAAGTLLAPVAQDLLRAMQRLHADRALQLHSEIAADLPPLPLDATSLHELLGNLLDNACQWARSRVELRAWRSAQGLELQVHDDGPGIAPLQRALALQRGQRLDEAGAGSGLGLTIVNELATLTGAQFSLETSPLGGLQAGLHWPAARLRAAGNSA